MGKDGSGNHRTGTLVPADPARLPDAVTAAVAAYLDEPETLRRHGEAGLALFRSGGFSEEAVVNRFLELLLD